MIPRCAFDLASDEAELTELTARSSDPNLWDDPAEAQAIMRRAEELRSGIASWQELEQRATGLAEMAEMAAADPDGAASLGPDLERDLASLQADWARANGHDIPERGRIPNTVREAFEAAN